MREHGFYWIVSPTNEEPEVAYWWSGQWHLTGTNVKPSDERVQVLSERLTPPAAPSA